MSDYNDGILPEPCLRMDTHFGDEYESIEFGDGTGYIKAAPILAKVGALHEEIDRLRDENAELRKMLDLVPNCDACEAMQDCWECLRADASHHERKRLSVENAELRDLCHDLYRDVADTDSWAMGKGYYSIAHQADRYTGRMRELGIEVE